MSSIIAKPLRRQSQRWHSSFAVARWRSEPLRSNLSDWLLLLFPGMVAYHYKCSLPARFPMKSIDTAAIDGLDLVPTTAMTFSTVRRRQQIMRSIRSAERRGEAFSRIDSTLRLRWYWTVRQAIPDATRKSTVGMNISNGPERLRDWQP